MNLNFKKYTSVFFDLDGVIYNSEPLRFKSYQIFFKKRFDKVLPDKLIKEIIGQPQEKNFNFFIKYLNVNKYEFSAFKIEREEILFEVLESSVSKDQTLINFLSNLKNHGFNLAIVSNSNRTYIEYMLDKLEITDFFKILISGEDYNAFKPDPKIYKIAIQKFNENYKNVIAIEDSYSGALSAIKAGLTCLGFNRGYSSLSCIDQSLHFSSIDQLNNELKRQFS
jgi:HAD superfamily hydrolase (TIGR01509 family)